MGCDTFVALAPATRAGVTLFAKNSDRPPRESQRIVSLPRRRSAAGQRLRCQWIDVPDVRETAAVVGSQPWWLWGFEHGVNEHRVAIGNETVYTKEALGPLGLVGMDLVRLGLERGRTAEESVEVMTALVERHGQGGSGYADLDWPYHNAFLVADPSSAWILETSGRHWVAKRVDDVANLSNGLVIGTDWARGAPDVTAFAVAEGWWPADAGPVDFAAAYNDDASVPENLCVERRRRGAALLGEARGRITPATMRAVVRDHYGDGVVRRPRDVADPFFRSLCLHGDPVDATVAAMVMELPRDADAIVRGWIALGSPCLGAFLPCYAEAAMPARLGVAGAEPDPASPWWRMHEIVSLVERDVPRWAPLVRARWDDFEAALVEEAADVEDRARRTPDRAVLLGAFMESAVERWFARAGDIRAELVRTGVH
jgi:secernin